jgi:hypothetical protein
MLLTQDKKARKDAVDTFKLVQMYMGDRNARGRDTREVARQVVDMCWSQNHLRDELFIQLCKQTTLNRNG